MSFTDKKGIVVASGFKLQAEAMIDARQSLDTIEDRDELVDLNAAVPGLRVYVKETKKSYVYNGTDWDELTIGAGYTHPTGDGFHHVPATGTNNNGKFLKAGSTAESESWENIEKGDIVDFPTSMKNPAALTISLNGQSQGAYDGSAAKTVNITPDSIGAAEEVHLHEPDDIVDLDEYIDAKIPESLPTSGSLTISLNGTSQGAFNGSGDKNINITPSSIGAAAASHSHTSANITDFDDAVGALIPDIPTKLPNPNALTFTGAVTGTYDGSAAKTVNIPTSGSTDEDLIIKFNGGSNEGTNMFTFDGSAAKSVNITPSSIGAAAASHSHTSANISDFDDAVAELIPKAPTKLPNPNALTISLNGTSQGAYDGSATKSVNITAASIGAAASNHSHTSANITDFNTAVRALIPSIPTKLPNPNALTFTGAVTGTYDGSSPKTVNIPTSGSTDGDLVIKLNNGSTEGTNMFTFDGSAAKTVNITAGSIGAAAVSHSHTSANITDFDDAVEALIPSIPTKLPNPNALTISLNGASQGAYDGSAAKSVNITAASIGAAAASHSHGVASTTAAGFLRQLDGSTAHYLRGDGTWGTPPNTTYSNMTGATSSAAGKAGLVPAPAAGAANRYLRSDGTWQVPPDTKATLSSLGITATAAELNFMDGVTSNVQTQLNGKAAASHGTHVSFTTTAPAALGTASAGSASTVSRSDHVHPLPTAAAIGAAAASHNHSAANITSGTLAVARGGTGVTANPSMLVNLGSTSAASVFAASPRPGITGTLAISHGGTGATTAAAARTALGITAANIGAAAVSHTHNYAGSSSAGGAATSANKVAVPVGTVLFSTSSTATFFSACFGGTWTVVGNVDAIINDGDSTLKLYMFRKTAA